MPDDSDAALDLEGAAQLLGVTPSCLRRWKDLKEGPAYYRAGRLIRYRREALLRWIAAHTVEPADTKTE